ncbi:hypothetical protein VPH35_107933 [Triticum aestivum]
MGWPGPNVSHVFYECVLCTSPVQINKLAFLFSNKFRKYGELVVAPVRDLSMLCCWTFLITERQSEATSSLWTPVFSARMNAWHIA